jgi:hypothetical protein
MAPMNGNIKSSERSVTEQRASIDPNKTSNAISYATKTKKIRNVTHDRGTASMIVWNLYAFFFQCQT